MILEHAVLDVIPGQEADFEDAFAVAKGLIAASPGFRSIRLNRCLEEPSRYLILVEWERLEDHLEGFRRSAVYEEWRGLLGPFYARAPLVEHFDLVASA